MTLVIGDLCGLEDVINTSYKVLGKPVKSSTLIWTEAPLVYFLLVRDGDGSVPVWEVRSLLL